MRVVAYDVNIVRDGDYEERVYKYNSDGHCEVVQIDLKVAFEVVGLPRSEQR
jgi:hypothetical protein